MKILAFERELAGATRDGFQQHAAEEACAAWDLYQAGAVRELYFRADQHTTVLVLESDSTEQAAAVLANLPLVREGLICFDLIPLAAYSGFARLFGEEKSTQSQ